MAIHIFASATHDFFFENVQLPTELRPLLKTDGQGIIYISIPHAEFFEAIHQGKLLPKLEKLELEKLGIRPEAFLPLSTYKFQDNYSTGKGANPAAVCGLYGLKPTLHCALGEDEYSQRCIDELTRMGVIVKADIIPNVTMAHAHIFIQDASTNLNIIYKGANNFAKVTQELLESLNTETTLLINTSVPLSETRKLLDEAGKHGVTRVVFNCVKTAGLTINDFAHVSHIVVNRDEAQALAEHLRLPHDEENDQSIAAILSEQLGVCCVMTRGGDSVIIAHEGRLDEVFPSPIKVVNVTGAGDGFLGPILAGLDRGRDIIQSVKEAIVVGGLIAAHPGPRRHDLTEQMIMREARAIRVAPTEYLYAHHIASARLARN